VPFKANQDRRHHIPKQRHRVTNWAAYDIALRQRGSLTVWFTEAAIAAWKAEPCCTRAYYAWRSRPDSTGVTLGVGVLTGAPLRVEAKTAGAGQKLSPGELVLKSEPRCYGKRSPRPTNQRLAGPVEFSVLSREPSAWSTLTFDDSQARR
jgi:hypothetical protein